MSAPQESNDSQESPLRIFPAALSMVCPGLGQLTQGRTSAFFWQFLFFALAAFVPVMILVNLIFKDPSFYQRELIVEIVFLAVTGVFPLLLALFSLLDAATWKNGKVGEKSRFRGHILSLFGYMVAFYFVLQFFFPVLYAFPMRLHRRDCSNRVKQIALALHSYHDDYGSFPPAFTVDENGKPLHSWRVLILPYIEQEELYREIRLDEPWNSEHNRQFHSTKVPTFACPVGDLFTLPGKKFPYMKKENFCQYSIVIGKETAFPKGRTVTLDDIQDGASKTVLVVERLLPICWMDPNREITHETALEGVNCNLYGVGSVHEGGANVALCDGSTHFILDTVDPKTWKAVLTIAGNETMNDL